MSNYKFNSRIAKTWVTPEVTLSEGFDSTGSALPAPFLPVLRENQEFDTWVVISRGTPVAWATNDEGVSYLVPAGYGLPGNDAKYTRDDVLLQLKDAEGNEVTEGKGVVEAMTAAGFTVSPIVGIASYDYFMHPGGDGINPCKFTFTNFSRQHTVAYKMDYHFELPMVKDVDTWKKAPLVGIAAFVGKKAKPGQFVTYNKDSNFVLASEADYTYGAIEPQHIVGQVSNVYKFVDPDTDKVLSGVNGLQHVVAPQNLSKDRLSDLSGVNTNGLDYKLLMSGGFGIIRFGLQTR